MTSLQSTTRHGFRTLVDLAWPVCCGACGAWGRTLCAACQPTFAPSEIVSRPIWAGELIVYSASRFEGPVRQAITAFKDGNRRDLAPYLAPLLHSAVARAQTLSAPGVFHWKVVLMPSSAASIRRRGRYPLRDLVAASDLGLPEGPQLEICKRVKDQSKLSRMQRRANLDGAMRLGRPYPLLRPGTGIILLDDVVTTGATLAAARNAITCLRPTTVVAATIAARGGSVAMSRPLPLAAWAYAHATAGDGGQILSAS